MESPPVPPAPPASEWHGAAHSVRVELDFGDAATQARFAATFGELEHQTAMVNAALFANYCVRKELGARGAAGLPPPPAGPDGGAIPPIVSVAVLEAHHEDLRVLNAELREYGQRLSVDTLACSLCAFAEL